MGIISGGLGGSLLTYFLTRGRERQRMRNEEARLHYEKRYALVTQMERQIEEAIQIVRDHGVTGEEEGSEASNAADEALYAKVKEVDATVRDLAYVVDPAYRNVIGAGIGICERLRMIPFLNAWETDGPIWDEISQQRASLRYHLNRMLRGEKFDSTRNSLE